MIVLTGPVARYAQRLHGHVGSGHHVASPLGAWLLLALVGPAATGATRVDLEEALGIDVDTAAATAQALLEDPHPLVASASALWERATLDELAGWRATLPASTETGPLPDQATLDAWARERTDGLIERFPLTVSPETLLILATALATRVSWQTPFEVAPADVLGRGSTWVGQVRRVLRTPAYDHHCWIAGTAQAGDVAVHATAAQSDTAGGREAGMLVVSVAAAPDVAPADVLAAAHEVAIDAATFPGGGAGGRRSLFDLPLGDTPLWTLREVPTRAWGGREERVSAVLPCWSAESRHDLTANDLGFDAAARALGELLGQPRLPYQAAQAAMARYGRYGFEAAAVTAFAMATGLPPEGVARVAELRFGHPYAVVAVATDRRGGQVGPWHGVPVYSAWVAQPSELPESDLAEPTAAP
ncbi:serpin family protein [Micromonospora krabiensis]|uniref:serpin family protein n=1 Tax=Micromonospora krabiensis TaxID=307121 RepID=UPI000B825CD1|nr:serpin family protein [Micromonospora krabiensis]